MLAELRMKLGISNTNLIQKQRMNGKEHDIYSIKEQENKSGKNAREIFELLQYLIGEAGVNAKKEDWQSYDRINELIALHLR